MAASNDMWTFKALSYGEKWRVTAQAVGQVPARAVEEGFERRDIAALFGGWQAALDIAIGG